MDKICYERASRDQLETVDNEISYILNKARWQVKEPLRGLPYSDKKMKSYLALKYWVSKVRLL